MKNATLGQGIKILSLVEQKEVPREQLQELLASGLLADLLDADVDAIDRDAFRKIVGLKHLNSSLLTVGYIMAPSLINLRVDTHPDRKDVATIDLSRVERVLTLMPGENRISGHENLKRLKATGKTLLDVRVLEELLKNPHLIPEEWKNGITYFWGTIFCGSGGVLCVAFLRWGGGRWLWGYGWPGRGWRSDGPAACLASSE